MGPMDACMHLSVCECACACVYRHVASNDVSVGIFASTRKYMCVSEHTHVFIGKEGRAIRNQTQAACASCPLFEDKLWSAGSQEEDGIKVWSVQVAKTESKSSLRRLVIQMPPSLAATMNLTLLLSDDTQTLLHKPAHYNYKDLCMAL